MATEAQLDANRENAKKSTGPRTLAGKAKAALNALKHGFRSKVLLTWQDPPSGERPAPYADFLLDLIAELQPAGVLESLCVETMALSVWRQRRVIERELHIVAMVDPAEQEPPMAPWEPWMEQVPEYVEHHEEELKRLANPGPGPSALPFPEKLLPLLRYEAHLDRQYQRAYRQLKELQAARLARQALSAPPSLVPTPTFPNQPNSQPAPPSPTPANVPNKPNPPLSPASVPSVLTAPDSRPPAFASFASFRAVRVPDAILPNEPNPPSLSLPGAYPEAERRAVAPPSLPLSSEAFSPPGVYPGPAGGWNPRSPAPPLSTGFRPRQFARRSGTPSGRRLAGFLLSSTALLAIDRHVVVLRACERIDARRSGNHVAVPSPPRGEG